jgi:hypothetical protein
MNDFDPQKPFIGSDGLEYACVADKILGQPRRSYYNEQITRYQEPDREEFRRKYLAYRESPQYDDRLAEGEERQTYVDFNQAREAFEAWRDGPDDPTPINVRFVAKREIGRHLADVYERAIFDHLRSDAIIPF